MSDPSQQPIAPTPDTATELETLRTVNADILAKRKRDKAKIAELELATASLQEKFDGAQTTIHDLTVLGPLKAMAESISIAPDLWLEQFTKSYQVEMVKGKLTLLGTDGKPVMKGKDAVPFEREALFALLTNEAHPQAKTFKAILIANRASGSNGSFGVVRKAIKTTKPTPSTFKFGLR